MHISYNLVIPFLHLYQCFSDFGEYQISLEDLLKPSLSAPLLRVFSSIGLVGEFAFQATSQVMVLMVRDHTLRWISLRKFSVVGTKRHVH